MMVERIPLQAEQQPTSWMQQPLCSLVLHSSDVLLQLLVFAAILELADYVKEPRCVLSPQRLSTAEPRTRAGVAMGTRLTVLREQVRRAQGGRREGRREEGNEVRGR